MAFATKHNGGRSQVNLNTLQDGLEFPFLNHLKCGQGWTLSDQSNVDPSTLDSDGYPTSVGLALATTFRVPTQTERSGNYKITWSGSGTISTNCAIFTGSYSTSGVVVTPPSNGNISFQITAIGSPGISNLQFFHVSDETALTAGDVFGVKFKQRLAEANFGVIRFLNWQSGNTTNVSNWYTMRPATSCFYAGAESRGTLWAGLATTSNQKAFTGGAPTIDSSTGAAWGGTLHDKCTVITQFPTRAGTGTITGISKAAQGVITVTGSSFAVGEYVRLSNVVGMTEVNGLFTSVVAVNGTSVTIARDTTGNTTYVSGGTLTHCYSSIGVITAATKAASCILTVDGTTYTIGETVYLDNVAGMVELNGQIATVTNVVGSNVTINVNSTGYTTFTTGGGGMCFHHTISFNVGGTGAKNVLGEYTRPIVYGDNAYPIGGLNLATMFYDAKLDAWIKQGSDFAAFTLGIDSGVPLDLCFRLCAEVGAHPWIVTPPFACTPMTDWWDNAAALAATYNGTGGTCPWMVLFAEPPNELWNTFQNFYQTTYAIAVQAAYGWGGNTFQDWYGKVASTIGQAVNKAYGNPTVSTQRFYKMFVGVQTAMNGDAGWNPRVTSAQYVAQNNPQSGYTATAASNWVTHVCPANYYGPSAYGQPYGEYLGLAYTAATTQDQKDALSKAFCDTANVGGSGGVFYLSAVTALLVSWKTWAKALGIFRMAPYEGGYSSDYGPANENAVIAASKFSPDLYAFTMANQAGVLSLNDSTFLAEFPSTYLMGGDTQGAGGTYSNVWSVFNGSIYGANTPQWNALIAFNAVKRAAPSLRIHG